MKLRNRSEYYKDLWPVYGDRKNGNSIKSDKKKKLNNSS